MLTTRRMLEGLAALTVLVVALALAFKWLDLSNGVTFAALLVCSQAVALWVLWDMLTQPVDRERDRSMRQHPSPTHH